MTDTMVRTRITEIQPPARLGPTRAGRAALLLIDWQCAFVLPDTLLHRRAMEAGLNLDAFDDAVVEARTRAFDLLKICREAGLDILHVVTATQLPDGSDASPGFPLAMWRGSPDAATLPELSPHRAELRIEAASLSPFNSTPLHVVLGNLGIDQVICTGLMTNGAVELTAANARDLGYEVIVAEDASAALKPELHKSALSRLQAAVIPTASLNEIREQIAKGGDWSPRLSSEGPISWTADADDPWEMLFPKQSWKGIVPGRTALVTVDMQYLNAHPDWGCGRIANELGINDFEDYFKEVEIITPTLRSIQDACRAAGTPLIHLRTACQAPDQRDSGGRRQTNRAPMAPLGTRETEFLEEVEPREGELVISKTSWGPFASTAIERVLRNLDVRHLIVVGVVTNGCVEMTVRDALDRGFEVTVVRDATATRTRILHEDALYRLGVGGAHIQLAQDIITALA